MDDPNFLSPTAFKQAREIAEQVALQEDDETTYWKGVELHSLLAQHLPDDVPGRLYVVWADLTDIWDLSVERRPESAALMREAAHEFLALDGTPSNLDLYLSRWQERLAQRND